uniref:Uncharacterized protein n=1 Tax=Aegilops tauschii subsp. strangulata TaxID=200361 RepID=A0A453J4X8_AEGTS
MLLERNKIIILLRLVLVALYLRDLLEACKSPGVYVMF